MTNDLVPWVTQNLGALRRRATLLATPGHEQNWLIGFSKSGIGGTGSYPQASRRLHAGGVLGLPCRHVDATANSGELGEHYGTDANFQANYRLTPIFLDAHKPPFMSNNRIWIGGYYAFQTDMSDYDALLNSEGIPHTTETPTLMAHRWDSGWVPIALSALSQDGAALAATP